MLDFAQGQTFGKNWKWNSNPGMSTNHTSNLRGYNFLFQSK
jgi:hypothetical protein